MESAGKQEPVGIQTEYRPSWAASLRLRLWLIIDYQLADAQTTYHPEPLWLTLEAGIILLSYVRRTLALLV